MKVKKRHYSVAREEMDSSGKNIENRRKKKMNNHKMIEVINEGEFDMMKMIEELLDLDDAT